MTSDPLDLQGIDYVEFYVSNARQAAHFYRTALGLRPLAYAGLETGSRDRASYVLARRNVKSTFFVIGEKLAQHRALAERAHAEGHWIGNHTLTHALPFGLMPPGAATAEFDRTQEAIATGADEIAFAFHLIAIGRLPDQPSAQDDRAGRVLHNHELGVRQITDVCRKGWRRRLRSQRLRQPRRTADCKNRQCCQHSWTSHDALLT